MSRRVRNSIVFPVLIVGLHLCRAGAKEIAVSEIEELHLTGQYTLEVQANPERGFHFPFYLFVPGMVVKGQTNRLLVESNNTGTATDDFEVHRERARKLATRSYANRMARDLSVPLLVPVFPRTRSQWRLYTHALDRDTLEADSGKLQRLDRQLLAMIDYALEWLRGNGFQMHDEIFMHGYSASAKFCNRFAFLHPQRVKAVAAGGVNGLPTLPIGEHNGRALPFPIGIADIEIFTGKPYDEAAHRRVAQYVYMGGFDRNDTLPSRDAWRESEEEIIRAALPAKMMPDRWKVSQAIYRANLPRAQCVTYSGVPHTIKDEMLDDVVRFFQANAGDAYAAIKPHAYPHVEYREIQQAHVSHIYWKGDPCLPDSVGRGVRNEGTFLIGISDWIKGQSFRQLDEFVENAGFHFLLRAEGQPEIVITRENYRGNSSAGDGEFQAFYARLNGDQLDALAPDVPYTLEPVNRSQEYIWVVNDGVTLIRTVGQDYSEAVLAALNEAIQSRLSFDCPVASAIALFDKMALEAGGEGSGRPIRFKANLQRAGELPHIKFSVQGLSVMEVLLVICHRAGLDYRIDGLTVYVEDQK